MSSNKAEKKKNAGKLYECFIENVKATKDCDNQFLKGKKVAIDFLGHGINYSIGNNNCEKSIILLLPMIN